MKKGIPKISLQKLKAFFVPLLFFVLIITFTTIVRAHGGDSSLIHSCVNTITGSPKIVAASTACGVNETATDWLKDVIAGAGLTESSGSTGVTLSLADGGVTTVKLANAGITTIKIADEAITTAKIANNAITSAKIANGAVNTAQLADGSVTQAKLANASALLADIKAYQVNPTNGQTTTSTTYVDMTNGTQQVVLSKKSVVYVNAHANVTAPSIGSFDLSDLTSNNNNLTNGGSTEVSTGGFGASTKSVQLVRSESDNLVAADSSSLSITGDLTIEAWVKFSTLTGHQAIVSKWSTVGRSYWLRFVSDNTLRFVATNNTSQNGVETSVSWTPSTNTWYHVAVAYNASAGSAIFYVDGQQQGTTQTGLPTSIADSTSVVALGENETDDGSGSHNLDGYLDEVRIWNTTRTSSQINDNKSIELAGSESGLVAYYPFESNTANGSLTYLRTTYDSGGSDTEIGTQGYTNVTLDGQSISAGGVAILNPGTYTVAAQKKVSNSSGTSATYNQPGMSIMIVPTE